MHFQRKVQIFQVREMFLIEWIPSLSTKIGAAGALPLQIAFLNSECFL